MVGNIKQKFNKNTPTMNIMNMELPPYTGHRAIWNANPDRQISMIAACVDCGMVL
jgi:hypothetical protein